MRAPETTSWHSASWQSKPAQQQPTYSDQNALQRTVAHLSRLPPIVVSWEVDALRERLAAAQHGQAFLLQGDDVFLASQGDIVARKYKIVSISGNSIQVEDLTNNNPQTLPLQSN